jgi:hypothetical protein
LERERDAWKQAAFVAHQTAALGRVAAKKFPALNAVLAQFDPAPAATAADVIAILQSMGGTTHER